MRRKVLRFGKGFRVMPGNRRSQAAEMVIAPGDAEGDPRNRHRGADVPPAYRRDGDALPRGRK